LERKYTQALKEGNKDEADQLLKSASSALDKAAKSGVVHWATANRKKSRLSRRLPAAA
jgi:small subunit ribosomal protein S20